jgi:hypothetical protein
MFVPNIPNMLFYANSHGFQGDTVFFSRSVTPQVTGAPDNPPPYSGTRVLENVMFKDINNKTLTLQSIPLNWTVAQLRQKLGDDRAIEAQYYRFIYGGKQLEDGIQTMSCFPVQ